LKKRHPAKKPDDPVLFEKTIQYILTTANNWSSPIGTFHLTVSTESPEEILLTCMAGVERTAPTRYELTARNFRPAKDLDLLILTARNSFE